MEMLLIAVTVISLGLAVSMSVVAWTLLRHDRQRAAARLEALEALAFIDDGERRPPVADPVRPAAAAAVVSAASPKLAPVEATAEPEIDAATDFCDWDAVIRGHASEPEVAGRTAIGDGRARAVLPDAMFGIERPSNASARRWLVVAAIGLLIAAGYATASAMRSPEVASRTAAPASQPLAEPQPLELLSLRHTNDAAGAFSVSGFVQNPAAGKELTNVEVVVYLFDANDQYFMTGRAPLEISDLRSGADSSFEVHIPGAANVGRYRVGFRQADGTVVAHLDKRGQFPDGSSETVVGADTVRPAGGMR